MSELFSRLQEELRFHKSHGIDLTHPRGVVLNDKLYPAKQKGLTIPKYDDSNKAAFLDIPYESENVAKVYHQVNASGSKKLNVSLGNPHGYIYDGGVRIGNGYRTKILHSYGEPTTNSEALESYHTWTTVPQKNKEPDCQHLHRTLKDWNNHPGESYVSKNLHSRYGDDSRPMTDRERLKHRSFSNEPMHNPDTLSVIHYPLKGGFDIYSYDVKTESLTPKKYSWENEHIWGEKDE